MATRFGKRSALLGMLYLSGFVGDLLRVNVLGVHLTIRGQDQKVCLRTVRLSWTHIRLPKMLI